MKVCGVSALKAADEEANPLLIVGVNMLEF